MTRLCFNLFSKTIHVVSISFLFLVTVFFISLKLSYAQTNKFLIEQKNPNANGFANMNESISYLASQSSTLLPPPEKVPSSSLHIAPLNNVTKSKSENMSFDKSVNIVAPKPQFLPNEKAPALIRVPRLAVDKVPSSKQTVSVSSSKAKIARKYDADTAAPNEPKALVPKPLAPSQPPELPKIKKLDKNEPNKIQEKTIKSALSKDLEKKAEKKQTVYKKIKVGRAFSVTFQNQKKELSNHAQENLTRLAKQLLNKPDYRLQLLAFAGADGMSVSTARRQSLSRALTVRSFLMQNDIRSTRIDVRALGNKSSEAPLNRVDVNIVKR